MVQTEPKQIPNAHSTLGFDFVQNYQELLSDVRLDAAIFLEHKLPNGHRTGQVHSHLPSAAEQMTRIAADTKYLIPKLVEEYAYDPARFVTHYQPTREPASTYQPKETATKKILWASRVSQQKRPDLVLAIADQLPDDVTIEMYGLIDG